MSNDASLPLPASLRPIDTVAEMRTTRCHKFIQVSVITMLLGDIGREAGGRPTFARHRPHIISSSGGMSNVSC